MEITRETDYAIRCILYMAKEPEKIFIVNEIAGSQLIPKSFLAKILQKLGRAGLVESIRGVKGGFQLAKKPKEINLLDVIIAIEGTVAMNRCAIDKRMCNLSNTCTVHPIWVDMRKEVERRLRKYDFARLAAQKR
ncbi:MAG: Rrf2 family transcriptional regulator [Nitrospirota bacterium]